MEEFKNLKEIIELSEEEINNNDENVSAVLDLVDLKELRNLIAIYKELRTHYEIICDDLEEHNLIYTDTPEFEENYIPKSKVQEKIEDLEKRGYFEEANAMQELLEES